MSINISYLAGAGAQFFDGNGDPLAGGLLYTYNAGTTTPVSTYTSRSGVAFNTNPIVLNSSGRTPAEIWLEGGVLYKFVLKNSSFVQIGSYDNIPAVNDPTTTNNLITVAGTNALTGLAIPPLEGYTTGAQYSFIAQNNNTAAVTIDIDTLGVKSITKAGSVALSAGDIVAGALYEIEYDGTRFQLLTRTSASQLVVGTTGQRPASPTTGMIRMNSTINEPEWYDAVNSAWLPFRTGPAYAVSYLVVAGGGGGGSNIGGGGGAGGLLASTTTVTVGMAYTITIGAGGGVTGNLAGTNGSNSVFTGIATATGGGGGGNTAYNGLAGGSGGGVGPGFSPGTGTSGQGFAGGAGVTTGFDLAGGGGGAGAVGAVGAGTVAGAGGAGTSSSISGSAVTRAGGGGGAAQSTYTGGAGGAGGGGAGVTGADGTAGTANTGGGGGGGWQGQVGGIGGSGVVIISYLGAQRGTGGTITSSGGYTIHTFTTSGTFTG
jgi:hypothetical protein